jgi:ABC-type sugar transport system permease subunit/ABC-type glycerol-3-phosphate transport system substrate-binding protein
MTWYHEVPYDTNSSAEFAAWEQWRHLVDPGSGRRFGDEIEVKNASDIEIEGSSLKLLQFAGGTAEDVILTHPDSFYLYRDQGFYLPLNPFIWKIRTDSSGNALRKPNGQWDYILDPVGHRQLLWKAWADLPGSTKAVLTSGDDVLGLSESSINLGLHWRKDVFQDSGLDPLKPPQTWDELFNDALKISASQLDKGISGFMIDHDVWYLATFTMGFHADLLRRFKTYGPKNSKRIEADLVTPLDRAPDGTDLRAIPERWKACFDEPGFIEVIKMLRKLALTRWVVGPNKEPIVVQYPDGPTSIRSRTLGEGQWKDGSVVFSGRSYPPDQIHTGVAYVLLQQPFDDTEDTRLIQKERKIAMFLDYPKLDQFTPFFGFQNLGFTWVPAGNRGHFGGAGGSYISLNSQLAKDPRKARLAWEVLKFRASDQKRLLTAREQVNLGQGAYLDPKLLKEAGFTSVLEQIPPDLARGEALAAKSGYPEPYAPRWNELSERFLEPAYEHALKDRNDDYVGELKASARAMNEQWEFDAKDYSKVKGRGLIGVLVFAMFVVVCAMTLRAIRGLSAQYNVQADDPAARKRPRTNGLSPFLLLAPGIGLILLFAYYPILQSLPLAFQDYKIVGHSDWVGLANFIELIRSERTYQTLLVSFEYLVLSIGLGFLAPVGLALVLSEIPRFKYFFRTVYYLPSVISGIVMVLLWKKLLDPKPEGLLNHALGYVGIGPQTWLQSEKLALPTIILIGIWGAAGPGTLIYLAALKSVPEDLYEAAELDGAGWGVRIRQITLSYLRPLLIINLVGAVIGAFQASQNILVLTGGGPNFKTQTFALEIFMQAFIFMKFGYATALAWIMGALLIGFTVWQLKILRQVEFRRANVD